MVSKVSMIAVVAVLVVVLWPRHASAQTPMCGSFSFCADSSSPCCQCTGGPATCSTNLGGTLLCESDCAAGITTTASDPTPNIHWTFYPISLAGVNTSHTYSFVISAYVAGQTTPVSTVTSVGAQASASWTALLNSYYSALSNWFSGTAPTAPAPTTITWTSGAIDFPPQRYTKFTIFVADSTANTYQSYLFTYVLTSGPVIATGIMPNLQPGVQVDTMPAITFAAEGLPNGLATFAYTASPTNCAYAGVSDANSCTSYCQFLNSYSTGASGTLTTNSDGSFACACSTSGTYGGATQTPVYTCQGAIPSAGTTSSSTTSSSSSSSSTSSTTTTTTTIILGGGVSDEHNGITQTSSIGGSGSNAGAIAGGIIGAVIAIALIVGVVVVVKRRGFRIGMSDDSAA